MRIHSSSIDNSLTRNWHREVTNAFDQKLRAKGAVEAVKPCVINRSTISGKYMPLFGKGLKRELHNHVTREKRAPPLPSWLSSPMKMMWVYCSTTSGAVKAGCGEVSDACEGHAIEGRVRDMKQALCRASLFLPSRCRLDIPTSMTQNTYHQCVFFP